MFFGSLIKNQKTKITQTLKISKDKFLVIVVKFL